MLEEIIMEITNEGDRYTALLLYGFLLFKLE